MGKAVSRGQALQISARVATQVNWDDLDSEDVQKIIDLSPREFSKLFTEFIQKGTRLNVYYNYTIDTDAEPFVPEKLKVACHITKGKIAWDPSKISRYPPKKPLSTGYEFRKELEGQSIMNACVLDDLLAKPALIPKEWKGGEVYFWGTIYCDLSVVGSLCVRFLFWNAYRWDWSYRWLDDCGWNITQLALILKNI